MHIPVLLEESVRLWTSLDKQKTVKSGIYIDATFGLGGHSKYLLDYSKKDKDVVIIGIDRDESQIKKAKINFKEAIRDKKLYLFNDSFANVLDITSSFQKNKKKLPVKGILFDFGMSTDQLKYARGFSFQEESDPLDMRFNPEENELTAADILNDWREIELEKIFKEFGEERYSRKVAAEIRRSREEGRVFRKVSDLLVVLKKTLSFSYRKQKIHYATRIFQALRISVNKEFENIERGLADALKILEKGSKIVAISFHSGEDRIVKHFFRHESKDCICEANIPICVCGHQKSLQIITRKPVTASSEEIRLNPNARSAKLRAAEKIVSES